MSGFHVKISSVLISLFMVVSLSAQDVKSLVYSGDIAFEEGNYYGASQLYKRVLRIQPDIPDVIYKMAESCRLDNNYQMSAKYYRKLILSSREKYPLAEYYLAQMLKSDEDYLKAQYHFRNFKKHYSRKFEEDYYLIRAEREIVACEIAQRMLFQPGMYNIVHDKDSLNTLFADFTLDGVKDSLQFVASIKQDSIGGPYYSRIYQMVDGLPERLPEEINLPDADVANPFWDEKNQRLYYTVSDLSPSQIYSAGYRNGRWTDISVLTQRVNYPGYATMHPAIFHTDTSSWILYASDKPGGAGGFDIYLNQMFTVDSFGLPKNWGRRDQGDSKFAYLIDTSSRFNTIGNEITPFYNVSDSNLYFSSDWHYGMGEYDIFRMKALPGDTGMVENVGYPINSPQNDVYFRFDRSGRRAMFTSNRNEALAPKHQSCCTDVFYYDLPEIIIEKTEEEIIQEEIVVMTGIAKELIPITLYFHNDRPGPGSWDTVTEVNYETSFENYLQMEEEYNQTFSAGLKEEALWSAQDSIEAFFREDVNGEFQKLRKFMLLLEELLEREQNIVITIKGYTSPLNTPEYNLNLAKRRISSLENYVREYKSGIFLPYLQSGLLKVERVPFGETQVRKGISDDPNDRRNSVYNPLAAKERKIQVIAVQIDNNN